MPKMVKAFRQRERVIERVWNPIAPNFIVYNFNGTIYARIYPLVAVEIHKIETGVDPLVPGIFFAPLIPPGLTPITAEVTLLTDPVQKAWLQGDTALVGGTTGLASQPSNAFAIGNKPSALVAGLVGQTVTPDGKDITLPPIPPPTIRIFPLDITVGTKSQPLYANSLLVRMVTILADSANSGTIFISSALNTPSGTGFPLVAGAAKDLGTPNLIDKLIDLSTIFVIGTNSADKIHILAEI